MWKKAIKELDNKPPKTYLDWMTKPYKLGDAIRQTCEKLTVKIIEQRFRPAFQDEWSLLKESDASFAEIPACFVREIFLEGDGVPFVFARVVIPPLVYNEYIDDFEQLGTKLIGETMLYKNAKTLRSAFEFAGIQKDQALHASIETCLPTEQKMETYWARRSIFYLDGRFPILITEAFMQAIPNLSMNVNMCKLFSYGTLQYEAVQLATFGRKMNGMSDVLIGFTLSQLAIQDPAVIETSGEAYHPILTYTGKETDTIPGMTFDVTPEEIEHADEYEVADYRRMALRLQSGEHAWTYVSADTGMRR